MMSEKAPKPNNLEGAKQQEYASLEKSLTNSSVVLVGGRQTKEDLAQRLRRGGSLALCINTKKRELYIGDDHRGMRESENIPTQYFAAGIVEYDSKKRAVTVPALWCWWREKDIETKDPNLLDIASRKLQDFLF